MFKRLLASKHVQHRIRWIMGLLAATLIIPMVIFFHSTGRGGVGPGGSAGEMFGRQVPWEDFQAEYRLVSAYFQERLGTDVGLEMFEPMLRAQTWDRLLLREDARRQIRLSDEDLALFIRSQPTFQREGAFSQELYYRFLQATGQSPQQFETRLRNDLRLERLIESLKTQVRVMDEEVRASYAKEYERLRAALILIDGAEFRPQAERLVTEETVRASYAMQEENLRIPAKRTIAYLGLSIVEALEASLPAEGTDADAPATEEPARKRLIEVALDIQEDLDDNRAFEEIAALRNLPIRTVGPIDAQEQELPSGLTPEMIREAFDVPVNDTTGLFSGETGVFLLQPTSEIPSRLPPFEEVQADLRRRLLDQQGRAAAQARATQLHDELAALRGAGKSFDEACALLGVQVTRPAEPFTKQGPIAEAPEAANVTEALFRLDPGELSDVLPTPTGAALGVLEERLPFDEQQFAKDRETYRTTVLERAQQTRISDYLQVLRVKARLKSYL